jgi:D-arabinose 1-dehydrogenase-like Zn-dependent alcohol dehydrogenase
LANECLSHGEAWMGAKAMKAAVVRNFREPLVVQEIPVPSPGAGEVLVKIRSTGVCHTDLHAADGDWPVKPTLPFVPGHEGAGVVAAVGAGVRNLKEGDPVPEWIPAVRIGSSVCVFQSVRPVAAS